MSHTPWNLARGEPLELHMMMMAATSMQPVENLSAIHHPSSIIHHAWSSIMRGHSMRLS
jgi:hypothetical protein